MDFFLYFCKKMRMKRFVFLSCLCFLLLNTFAQSNKDMKKRITAIKENADYFWGESSDCSSTIDCDDSAMTALIKYIASHYKADIIYFSEDDKNSQINNVYTTFDKVLLTNSEQIILNNDIIFRYISKEDFNDLCEDRARSIQYYINEAKKAERQLRIGDALKYFYWSALLCHSHPNGNDIVCFDEDDNEHLAYKWIMNHINNMLRDISIIPKATNKDSDDIELIFTYCGDRISDLGYRYNDGQSMRRMRVNNGKSLVHLRNSDLEYIDIIIDVECREEAENFDREVYVVMNILNKQIHISGANKQVVIKNIKQSKKEEPEYQNKDMQADMLKVDAIIKDFAEKDNQYAKSMKIIEYALRTSNLESARNCFTEEGYTMLTKLAKFGKMTVMNVSKYDFVSFKGEVICRSIPIQFDFKNNVGFMQNVVFRFDEETKKVTSLAFRLTDIAECDILGKDKWDPASRLTLISFLEDYQTAYALKNLKYLDQVFSDDALIIVGHVLENKKKSDNIYIKDQRIVKLTQKTKSEYMQGLERAFNSREYINLRFTETNFVQAGNGEDIYGVQIRQEYFSNSYNDVGYLFLMVDLRGAMPCIHVRAWQPDKTDMADLVKLGSFRIE